MKIFSIKSLLLLVVPLFFMGTMNAQDFDKLKKERDSIYQINIKKSRLYGVYIPVDLMDAFHELKTLSGKASLEKYVSVSEDVVAKKLFFGLGRWMSYNWVFDEGSRFSHYLTGLGLKHPDDMVSFMLISFHRHLINAPLKTESLVLDLNKKRKESYLKGLSDGEIIKTETRVRPKN